MHEVLGDLLDKTLVAYLDEILGFRKSIEEHGAHVPEVLGRQRRYGLCASREKREFHRDSVLS